MKIGIRSKILALFLILSINAIADCNWEDIVKNPNDTFTYSKELHICVGQLIQDNKVKAQQISDFTQAITFKDSVIKTDEKRIQDWAETSTKLQDRLQKVDNLQQKNQWLFYGLGVATVLAGGWVASQLYRR